MILLPNGDTVIAVTKAQMKTVNLMKVEHDRMQALLKNTQSQIVLQDTALSQRTTVINLLQSEKAKYTVIMSNDAKVEADLQAALDAANKQIKRLTLKAKILGYVAVGTSAVAVVAILTKDL